ncbi:MAG: hypothetical protein WCH65_07860 [bacterium]
MGSTNVCHLHTGNASKKATKYSSSRTLAQGSSPASILQNTQSDIQKNK